MTAMLIKNRARKPLATGRVTVGWCYGVCGFPGIASAVAVELTVGEHRLYITELEWLEIVESVSRMMAEHPATA